MPDRVAPSGISLKKNENQVPDLRQYWRILLDGKWYIISALTLALVAGAFYTYARDPTYQTSAEILIERKEFLPDSRFLSFTYYNSYTRYLEMENLKRIMTSPQVVEKAQRILNGKYHLPGDLDSVSVEVIEDTDFVKIDATGSDPERIKASANSLVQAYAEYNRESAHQKMQEIRAFLEAQMQEARGQLEASERKLQNYRKQAGIISLEGESKKINDQLTQFEIMLNMAGFELKEKEFHLEGVERQLSSQKGQLPYQISEDMSPIIEKLQEDLSNLEAERIDLLARGFSDESPEVGIVKRRINGLKQSLERKVKELTSTPGSTSDSFASYQRLLSQKLTLEVEIKSLQNKMEILEGRIQTYRDKLKGLSDKGFELAMLQHEVDFDKNMYTLLRDEYERTQIATAAELASVTVVRWADAPTKPIRPDVKRNLLLAALVGLLLGGSFSLLKEFLNNTFRTPGEVERTLEIPGLGAVCELNHRRRNGNGQAIETLRKNLVTEFKPKSSVVDSYISIEANIRFSSFDRPLKSLMVTSSMPGEGKSTTACNLAIIFSQLGRKTLLVDSELRHPVIHKIFGLKKEKGLSDVAVGNISLDEALRKVKLDGAANFYLMPPGHLPPNPSELMRSTTMDEITKGLKSRFDVVIFDSPPVNAVADSCILGRKIDGALLVIEAEKTDREAVRQAQEQLSKARVPLIGFVLNRVRPRSLRYYGYYYGYYYSYYGKGYGDGYGEKEEREEKRFPIPFSTSLRSLLRLLPKQPGTKQSFFKPLRLLLDLSPEKPRTQESKGTKRKRREKDDA